ncbi:hypothetical protein B0T13DRAFT_492967 [Neurospora crassa]|nr:hypothetical protein B0T13DRAFT_492967 [Neurospora crassa]
MAANLLFVALAIRYAALAAINRYIYEYGIVDTFRWSRPFPDDGTDPGGLLRLSPWHNAIEDFLGRRSYMGSWDGVDHKGNDREIVVMEYADVPGPARDWIETQQRDTSKTDNDKWMFAVFRKPQNQTDKVTGTMKPAPTREAADAHEASPISAKNKIVVFPAGAIYEILPLWVSKGSKCEPWVTSHPKPRRDLGNRDNTFKIEAMAVTGTEKGKHTRLMWEKMHRTSRRNERRIQRRERQIVRS